MMSKLAQTELAVWRGSEGLREAVCDVGIGAKARRGGNSGTN